MRVMTIVGARPQFIKAAPLCFAMRDIGIRETLVHTGQHYDERMSDVFFREMGIPAPDHNLAVGSGSHGKQTAEMLVAIEALLLDDKPDLLLVYGDTNSTLAGALAASKLNLPIAHVEAGLRSFNRSMPEEVNRVLTDHCSTLLFCPTQRAVTNLAAENIHDGVHLVGDTMYDALMRFLPVAGQRSTIIERLGLRDRSFFLATIHRPYNADDGSTLRPILDAFCALPHPVVFPVHPRTLANLAAFDITVPSNVIAIDPVGYFDMLVLLSAARVVLTDSGGVQKEACFAGTPCVTLRPETEWVETVESGWNRLAWGEATLILDAVEHQSNTPARRLDAYGDGNAAGAIADHLMAFMRGRGAS